MIKAKISPIELFSLMFLFLVGSAIVVGWNFEAKQGVGITIFISMCFGLVLYYLYVLLQFLGNQGNLLQILETGFGKWLGKSIGFLYCIYFLYIASRVLKDFSFFIAQILFQNVSFWVITLTFLLVVTYACYLGIEAIARSSLILSGFAILFIILFLFFGFISPDFHWEHLTPIFQTSWNKILSSVFPAGITFPYGELIVFTMIFPFTNNQNTMIKYGWTPVCLTAFLLLLAGEMILGLLHPETVTMYSFPFVKALENVNFLQFVQHLEVLAVLINLIGGYIKISIFMMGAISGLRQLFPSAKMNRILFVGALIIFLFSFMLSTNLIEHLYIGLKIVPYYLHIPFQIVIPAALVITLLVKKYAVKSI